MNVQKESSAPPHILSVELNFCILKMETTFSSETRANFYPVCTASHPRRQHFRSHGLENLKFQTKSHPRRNSQDVKYRKHLSWCEKVIFLCCTAYKNVKVPNTQEHSLNLLLCTSVELGLSLQGKAR